MSLEDREFGIAPVNSIRKALQMRSIINQVYDTYKISVTQQIKWYLFDYLKSSNRAYLVIVDGEPVGYGLVVDRDGEWTIAGALLDNGIGAERTLFRFLTQDALLSSGKDVFVGVTSDNLHRVRLYTSLGYHPVAVDQVNGVIKMKWTGALVQA